MNDIKSLRHLLCGRGFGFVIVLLFVVNCISAYEDDGIFDLSSATLPEEQPNRLGLWLTISARKRFIVVSWKNAPVREDDRILLTTQEPHSFERVRLVSRTPLANFDEVEGSGADDRGAYVPIDGFTSTERTPSSSAAINILRDDTEGSGGFEEMPEASIGRNDQQPTSREYWISNNGMNDIVVAVRPRTSSHWLTTGVPFDYGLSRNVTTHTRCYGYWASYINGTGSILASACIRAYPRWMNEMRSVVGALRMRDLFLIGTHDSGSYRPNFDPLVRETIVTKYALTQDDDIRGQLMHGARYLDIRVGYYRNTPERFFINHGITKQRPLQEIIQQVKDFVLETNEIVIFGLKEFPVGFGKNLGVHRLLVSYLKAQFGELIVHPSATWRASLRDMWYRRQNVILAYDKGSIVQEFPHILFASVEQRWGNVRNLTRLEQYLRTINTFDVSRLSSRPVADMAELTPDTWGVILDKYGGLRKMADNVNWRVSELYRDELGQHANIVAVDFIRGTSLMESAIDWNKRKVIY